MIERDREIRRRRHRREKAKKARIRVLIAQSKAKPKKQPTEATEEVKEKKIIQKKPAVKLVRPEKKAGDGEKEG